MQPFNLGKGVVVEGKDHQVVKLRNSFRDDPREAFVVEAELLDLF